MKDAIISELAILGYIAKSADNPGSYDESDQVTECLSVTNKNGVRVCRIYCSQDAWFPAYSDSCSVRSANRQAIAHCWIAIAKAKAKTGFAIAA